MLKKILYALWFLIFVVVLIFAFKNGSYSAFIKTMENKTFDIRQNLIANSGLRRPNKDIVIVAIDDASYEYILDNYGEWPLRRDAYAKIVDFIESQNPKSIAFDLMFVKSMKSDEDSDNALIDVFKKYDNVFTAMNLDDQPQDLRVSPNLPDKLSVKGEDNLDVMEYSNCRVILQGIVDATSNIGMINVSRSDDGVLRQMPVYLKYNGKFYPQLGYLVANHYLGKDVRKIKHKKPNIILNWYGPSGTFENIPLYKVLKASEGKGKLDYDFKGKIVYFGATASSLFDIKTVPVDKVYPGVEVQATYVNNIIDNSYIKKSSACTNIIFTILLALITIICVLKIVSIPLALTCVVSIYALYILFAYEMMHGIFGRYYWFDIVNPLSFGILAFIVGVVIKYLIKSRDFDEQYKLATTDGLTELYNHRYFQEQMQMFCSQAQRYDSLFSLIILDIDYFKKFNDNFGHQSGDAVLKQVASLLKKNVRSSDIVCRYGGEEMSIILPNTDKNTALSIAEKLCKIVSDNKFCLSNNRESNVTISLGVSTYSIEDGTTPQKLIETADNNLYNAKNNGRNRVN